MITACLKPSAGGGLVMRLYESKGQTSEAIVSGLEEATVRETNIVEDPIGNLNVENGELKLSFGPFQVRMLAVEVK